jgi:hypothetical protein
VAAGRGAENQTAGREEEATGREDEADEEAGCLALQRADALAAVKLHTEVDQLVERGGFGAPLEGVLHLLAQPFLQVVTLGLVVPIQVTHQPVELCQIRAELQIPLLQRFNLLLRGDGAVRIVVGLPEEGQKVVQGAKLDNTGVLVHEGANLIQRGPFQPANGIPELGLLRGVVGGLGGQLVPQQEGPRANLPGGGSIEHWNVRVPPRTVSVSITITTTRLSLGRAHSQSVGQLGVDSVELLLKCSGIVLGGIAFGGGDSELILGLLKFQIGGGWTGGDRSGSGGNGRGRRLEDNIGEGFGVRKRFPHLLVGGFCVSEGREMSDGIGREEAAEFGKLGGSVASAIVGFGWAELRVRVVGSRGSEVE